jgi:hypothetical protein
MAELREITRRPWSFDSDAMTSSVSPSLKNSCSGSELRFANGRTTRDRGGRLLLKRFRETEIEHLHPSAGRDHHVGRLQVAVDDAFLVRRCQGLGDLRRIGKRFVEGKSARRDARVQALAFHELHREEAPPGDFFEGIKDGDARMSQVRQRACLASEARPPVFVLEELFRQQFQRDGPVEPRVLRSVDLAHATGAEGTENLVRAQSGSSGERHRLTSAPRSGRAYPWDRMKAPATSEPLLTARRLPSDRKERGAETPRSLERGEGR